MGYLVRAKGAPPPGIQLELSVDNCSYRASSLAQLARCPVRGVSATGRGLPPTGSPRTFLAVVALAVWQPATIAIQPNGGALMDKDPRKEARRFFREYGGKVLTYHRHVTDWQFPDGFIVRLGDDDHHGVVARKIAEVRNRYGRHDSVELTGLQKVGNAPRLDLKRLHASDHAKERLRLMQSQRRVSFTEVLHTLRLPERVMWSERHESWVWIRHPLAVAVCSVPDGHLIKTILWADNDLFALHPRPKEYA